MTDYLTDAQNNIKTYLKTHHIPIYFYQCFFGELVKVFGVQFLIPHTDDWANYDDDGNIISGNEYEYSYKDQLEYYLANVGGTGGWYEAFSTSCDQCGIMDIYDDYCKMDWICSDIFDGYIADKMLEILFDDTKHNDYYKYKMQKEKQL